MSVRHCAATTAPRNCCPNCYAEQTHKKDNVRSSATGKQLKRKKSNSQAQLHLPALDLLWANLWVQHHLPPLDLAWTGISAVSRVLNRRVHLRYPWFSTDGTFIFAPAVSRVLNRGKLHFCTHGIPVLNREDPHFCTRGIPGAQQRELSFLHPRYPGHHGAELEKYHWLELLPMIEKRTRKEMNSSLRVYQGSELMTFEL